MKIIIGILIGSGLTYWSIKGYTEVMTVIEFITNKTNTLTGSLGI